MDERDVKLSEAIAKLLSEDNKDKSLGEIGEDLSDYLIQIKEMVEKGDITYGGLIEEISKYIVQGEIPKPGSVSQLLLGCIEGEEFCPLNEEKEDVTFIYDTETQKFVSISSVDTPANRDVYAILYLTGDPREVDIDSFRDLETKGFEKIKIRHKSVSESSYREVSIENLERYIKLVNKTGEVTEHNLGTFMSICFLVIVLFILYFMKNGTGGRARA